MIASPSRIAVLSLAVLLASTSFSSAGFIWLSPEGQTAEGASTIQPIPVEPGLEAETAAAPGVDSPSRPWTLEGLIDAANQPAPAAPLPAVPVPQTMAAQPVYSAGDAAAPVALAPTAQPLQMPVVTEPVATSAPEVLLAGSSALPPAAAPVMVGSSATSAMPNAQSLIDGMQSMTAPRTSASAPAVVMAAPAASVTPVVPPVLGSAGSPFTGAAPVVAPAAPVAPQVVAPVVAPAPVQVEAPEPAYTVAEGFGSQVPLAIALRQIVPGNFSTMQSEGLNLDQPVTWQGGRPWPQVLSEAVRPLGLSATVSGNVVMIARGAAAAALISPPLAAQPRAVLTNATMVQQIIPPN